MRPNLGYYVQTINKIVQDTEEIGEKMNPSYEVIRQAIDKNKLADVSTEQLTEILALFNEGTVDYKNMLATIRGLRPPANVMGMHKKLERSYMNYVAGCEEMIQSIDLEKGVDIKGFDAAEEKQDVATDDISVAIQRMTNVLLKR